MGWKYITVSAALCLVTLLCMVLTGPSVGPSHRRLVDDATLKRFLWKRLREGESVDHIRETLDSDTERQLDGYIKVLEKLVYPSESSAEHGYNAEQVANNRGHLYKDSAYEMYDLLKVNEV